MKQDNNIENQFDSLFKEALENADVKAPEGLWQQIATQIPATPVSSVFSGFVTTAKLIGLASIATVIGVVIWNNVSSNDANEGVQDNYQIQEVEIKPAPKIQNVTQIESPTQSDESINSNNELFSQTEDNFTPSKEEHIQSNKVIDSKSTNNVSVTSNDNYTLNNTGNKVAPNIAKVENTELTPVFLPDTFLCQRNFKLNRSYFGNYKSVSIIKIVVAGRTLIPSQFEELEGKEYAVLTVTGLTSQNQQIQRDVHFNNKSFDIQIENTGEGSFKASYQANGYCVQNYWYVNNEIKEVDIKDIVYYRNLEFEGMQQVELKMVCYDDKHCVDSVMLDATPYLQSKGKVTVPNVFTPNNDGLNDVWQVMLPGAIEINIKVYDQDQQVVFQTNSVGSYWDGNYLSGKQLPSGSYMYLIHYSYAKEKPKQIGGFVKLIRN